jgi:hypothetical protein
MSTAALIPERVCEPFCVLYRLISYLWVEASNADNFDPHKKADPGRMLMDVVPPFLLAMHSALKHGIREVDPSGPTALFAFVVDMVEAHNTTIDAGHLHCRLFQLTEQLTDALGDVFVNRADFGRDQDAWQDTEDWLAET